MMIPDYWKRHYNGDWTMVIESKTMVLIDDDNDDDDD